MKKFLSKINNALTSAELLIGSIMLIMIVLLVFINAWTRMARFPISITQEGSQLLFIWISMIGADLALKKGSHMGVDIVVRIFPHNLQKIIKLFTYGICTAFLIFMIYWGTKLCLTNYMRTYSTIGISYTTATVAIPLLSIIMLLTIVESLIDLIENWNKPLNDASSMDTINVLGVEQGRGSMK